MYILLRLVKKECKHSTLDNIDATIKDKIKTPIDQIRRSVLFQAIIPQPNNIQKVKI